MTKDEGNELEDEDGGIRAIFLGSNLYKGRRKMGLVVVEDTNRDRDDHLGLIDMIFI